jgi:DNA-binding HxlR family transcriptional regulator
VAAAAFRCHNLRMKRGYGQYCPLALAAELLCERWTLLVMSRLLDGCEQFNQIHRGVPRISPSLLSRRLGELERAGLLTREPARKGMPRRYAVTPAGRELEPIIMQIAVWGQRWSRDMTHDDLDPGFLVWSMSKRLDAARMPAGRTVVEFEFTGASKDCRRFWLVNEDGRVEMCLKHPGFEVDLRVESDLRLFVEAWRGIRNLRGEIAARHIRVTGQSALRRAFPAWLQLSQLAPYPRKRPGRERMLMLAAPARRREADLGTEALGA